MEHFKTLNGINVNDKTEKKSNLTYLSWAWAWSSVKSEYPEATYEIKKFENNLPYVHDEKTGYMVFTTVTIEGLTHEMWLPVMDNKNKSLLEATMFDINKTIMRCLTKNLAMFGLGLYIYAGEDLPDGAEPKEDTKSDIISEISKIKTVQEVPDFYNKNIDKVSDKSEFIKAINNRKKELASANN